MNNELKYWLVDSYENLEATLDYLRPHAGTMAVDTECTSEYAQTAKLLGVSISIAEGEAFYIKFADFDGNTYTPVDWVHHVRQGIIDLLEDSKKKVIMFNSVYDVLIFENNTGADAARNLYADVILMKHLLEEEPPHGLKPTAIKHLGPEWEDGQNELGASVVANGGKWTADQKDFYKASIDVLSKYACMDADMTLRLFNKFEPELAQQKLLDFFYNKETMPLNKVVIGMHRRGIKVDIKYYQNLSDELTKEVENIQVGIHDEIKASFLKHYESLEKEILDKNVPIKSTGLLFEEMYEISGFPIVINPKTGQPTYGRKVVELAFESDPKSNLLAWRLGKLTDDEFRKLEADLIYQARVKVFQKQKDRKYVVNVLSNDQLGELLFTYLGEKPLKKTDKGRNKIDEAVIESFEGKYKFIDMVLQFRKINKLLNTYVKAALDKNIEGIIYPSWMQFGTTSGRFSSREPNYQNLPREDKRVKKGIIARPGYVLIGADYSQLEPRCFAHCSKETDLIQNYVDNEDLYSTIAIKIFKLNCTPSEVKTKHPNERQICKTIALAVTYGAKEWKIAKILSNSKPPIPTTPQKAKRIIDDYFIKYPELEKYILSCHGEVITYGRVVNETGRIRHLKDILNYKNGLDKASQNIYRNYLNLSVNFPIQSLAASIVNRAMIAIDREFKKRGLDAHIIMQVHDEIITEAREDQAEEVKAIMKDKMENNYKLRVPLVAEPKMASNLSETK